MERGYLYQYIEPAVEKIFVRDYVEFNEKCGKVGLFGAWIGGYNPPTAWPQGGAGSTQNGQLWKITQNRHGANWVKSA